MASNRPLTWRVENIPQGVTAATLKQYFHSDDRHFIQVKSLVPDVNNYDGTGTSTATILFSPPEPRNPRIDPGDIGEELMLDKDFIGFTPLNEASCNASADIVAITGLAGHAFGSWAHSPYKMWLRDYLPRDIQNQARILIYGYDSQLQGDVVAKSIISDYSSSFCRNLMDIRTHPPSKNRPLILIGHSLGALIIKQAITDLDPSIRKLLPIRTLLFFGAPHNGLETEALASLVKGQPTATLIYELKHDSPTLDSLARRFKYYAENLSIHSYYESRPTKTVVENDDGKWERCGPLRVMVEKSSAVLNYPQEQTQMKVDGDHSQIAKLRPGQGGAYPNVLRVIKDGLQSASEQYAAIIRKETESPLLAQPLPFRVSATRSTAGDGNNSNNETVYSANQKAKLRPDGASEQYAAAIPKEPDARSAQPSPIPVTVGDDDENDDDDDDGEPVYSVYVAKQAELAERYEEMTEIMKHIACENRELSVEERNLLSVAYKNLIGSRRASWRTIMSNETQEESKGNASQVRLIKKSRRKIEVELTKICKDILEVLDKHLIPHAGSGESKVFFYKMKGDYYRYLAEIAVSDKRKEFANKCLEAYDYATDVAHAELTSTHPIRLGLALNFSCFYYEILEMPDRACHLAKTAFDDAIADLDTLSEDSYKDSTLIMQLMRDNLTTWTAPAQAGD